MNIFLPNKMLQIHCLSEVTKSVISILIAIPANKILLATLPRICVTMPKNIFLFLAKKSNEIFVTLEKSEKQRKYLRFLASLFASQPPSFFIDDRQQQSQLPIFSWEHNFKPAGSGILT